MPLDFVDFILSILIVYLIYEIFILFISIFYKVNTPKENIEQDMFKKEEKIKQDEIYIVGSLKQVPKIRAFAERLRKNENCNCIINDWWTSQGNKVDAEYWKYCTDRNLTYGQALQSDISKTIFKLDKSFIDRASCVIMIQPCGKSAALELGYAAGLGKYTIIIKDPQHTKGIEIMENFADEIFDDEESFFKDISFVFSTIRFYERTTREIMSDSDS